MDGKESKTKIWKKIGFGILFVAACFAAMYTLIEYSDSVLYVATAAVVLLITAFLFLNAIFSDKAKKWMPENLLEEEPIATGTDGEFHLKVVKHMKEMESTQKELISVLKNQNTLIQNQIENLEHEIYMLSEKQVNQAKSIIKYNKENARQLAISERETLEYVMMELKSAIENNAGPAAVREVAEAAVTRESVPVMEMPQDIMAEIPLPVEEPVAEPVIEPVEEPVAETVAEPVLEEVSEAELFEVSDFAGDDEMAEQEAIPELPDDIDISELFDIPELNEPLAEEKPEEAEEPASDPLASLTGGDPNAMMTPEDIAKLLEAMGQ